MAVAMVTTEQVRYIRSLVHGRLGWSDDYYHDWLRDRGGPTRTRDLTRAQAANLIDILKGLAFGERSGVWAVDQATLLQRREIERLARLAGWSDEYLGGIVAKAARGRTDRVDALTIWEARDVIDGLKDAARRERLRAERAGTPRPAGQDSTARRATPPTPVDRSPRPNA